MRIDRIEVFVTDLPLRFRREMSSGRYDTLESGELLGKPVFVKLFADGVEGHGQIRPISPSHFVPETVHSVVSAVRDVYGPAIIGQNLFQLEQLQSRFDNLLPFNANARAVLDLALHDAIGKALDVPVHIMLGGLCQPRIPLEWSVSLGPQARMVEDAITATEHYGMGVVCLKAGARGGWRIDIENVAAVREALGGDVVLGVDPNTGWTVSDTKRALVELEALDVDYLEQPIKREDHLGLAEIRRGANGIALMADESLASLSDAFVLASSRAVDVFCIKLYKVGGLRQAKKISAVAEAANVRVNVGGLAVLSELEAAAGAHFYASTPEAMMMPAAEFIFGLGVLGEDPLVPEPTFEIRDGCIEPPEKPGLGVAIDDGALDRFKLLREVVT